MSAAIKGIIFDLVGTLVSIKDFEKLLAKRLAVEFNLEISEDELAAKLRDSIWGLYRAQVSSMRYRSFRDVLRRGVVRVLRDLGIYIAREDEQDIVESAITALIDSATVYDDAMEVLKRVKELGYSAVIATNLDQDIARRLLISLKLFMYFNGVVSADQAGCPKPCPKIGTLALRRLRVRNYEALLVGDSLEDVLLGKAIGVFTVLVDREGNKKFEPKPDLTVKSLVEILRIIER